MAKTETSKKQLKSETKSLKEHVPFKSDILKDSNVVTEALLDCIRTNDLESFRELLAAHLLTVNKMELAKKAGIGRRTLYDLIDTKKEFNPGLTTISALINAIAA
jgi:DNA-binding phage protein